MTDEIEADIRISNDAPADIRIKDWNILVDKVANLETKLSELEKKFLRASFVLSGMTESKKHNETAF